MIIIPFAKLKRNIIIKVSKEQQEFTLLTFFIYIVLKIFTLAAETEWHKEPQEAPDLSHCSKWKFEWPLSRTTTKKKKKNTLSPASLSDPSGKTTTLSSPTLSGKFLCLALLTFQASRKDTSQLCSKNHVHKTTKTSWHRKHSWFYKLSGIAPVIFQIR